MTFDEAMSSKEADWKRPSWVKEVDKPTAEIDWSAMNSFDPTNVMWEQGFAKAVGAAQADVAYQAATRNRIALVANNTPGFTLKDWAFNNCRYLFKTPGYLNPGIQTFLGPQTSPLPSSLNMPRYEGTPEENARMIRAFLRVHGASEGQFCRTGYRYHREDVV